MLPLPFLNLIQSTSDSMLSVRPGVPTRGIQYPTPTKGLVRNQENDGSQLPRSLSLGGETEYHS